MDLIKQHTTVSTQRQRQDLRLLHVLLKRIRCLRPSMTRIDSASRKRLSLIPIPGESRPSVWMSLTWELKSGL